MSSRVLRSSSKLIRKRKRVVESTNASKRKTIPVSPLKSKYKIDRTWISPTKLRNHLMKDPLIDWLIHNRSSNYDPSRFANKPPDNSFTNYIMTQGKIFEDKVIELIYEDFGEDCIAEIGGETDCLSKEKLLETLDAMNRGIPFIHSGLLHDHVRKIFGIPDLLVRSDWINSLIDKNPLSRHAETISAPRLIDENNKTPKYHYVVVDIKFSTLYLRADGIHLLNSGSIPPYKAQVWAYNEALALLQGYKPTKAYLLGRKWVYTSKGKTYKGSRCFDCLGEVDFHNIDKEYEQKSMEAVKWIRDVRSPASKTWNVSKSPLTRKELYPNMSNTNDYPWRSEKEKIANNIKELTSLWMVGVKHREFAHNLKIYNWDDSKCNTNTLGFKYGSGTSRVLSKILDINRNSNSCNVSPEIIKNDNLEWQSAEKNIEFYVDFESSNDVFTDFSTLPLTESKSVIFMIGVGFKHPKTNRWTFKDFTANSLDMDEEKRICSEFSNYIKTKSDKYQCENPLLVHWSPAETTMWRNAINRHSRSAKKEDWIDCTINSNSPEWFDLLKVFKAEPIVIRGCFGFSLKQVAKSLYEHGLIKTTWDTSGKCLDGQGAMVSAWDCHNECTSRGTLMSKHPTMKEIRKYNEVDVKVLQEIIEYIRNYHTGESTSIDDEEQEIDF